MTARARVRLRRAAGTALLLAGLSACSRPEGSPPAVHTAAERLVTGEAEAEAPVDEVVAPEGRDLWFANGPGRSAILAREREDHEAAVALLDAVLASDELPADDRAAAELLHGLEDLRGQQYAAAADRFARAASVPVMRPIHLWLVAWEAQARLDAGEPQAALALVASAADRERSPLAGDLLVIEGDARVRTGDDAGAQAAYRRYIAAHPSGVRRFEVEAKLARALVATGDPPALVRAVALYEGLLLRAPLSDFGEEAGQALPELRRVVGGQRTGKAARSFEHAVELAHAQALLDHRRYPEAVQRTDRLARSGHVEPGDRCHALFIKGSAIFKQRRRADARSTFDRAARLCATVGDAGRELTVKSRYQAARGRYADRKYSDAANAFESLARDFADHSYADDAWLLAAESWAADGNADKSAAALRNAMAARGDMQSDARRRLLVNAFANADAAAALALADEAIKLDGAAVQWHYARGRALRDRAETEAAAAAFVRVVELEPLGYTALQALSRLRELGPKPLAQGLARMTATGGAADAAVLATDQRADRALVLARLGLGPQAAAELEFGGVNGWPAVAVLDQAGLHSEAQRVLGSLGHSWRASPPLPANRWQWTLAQPRPFADLIDPRERTHAVPSLLTFAIMQTESRFDPSVTSWAGARGLVQLMPATAKDVASLAGLEITADDLFDPKTNLELGIRHLGQLVARFGGDNGAVALAVPGYNAGAGAVERWLRERRGWDLDLFIESIPYDETRRYTKRVLGRWFAYRWLYGAGEPHERVPYLPRETRERSASRPR